MRDGSNKLCDLLRSRIVFLSSFARTSVAKWRIVAGVWSIVFHSDMTWSNERKAKEAARRDEIWYYSQHTRFIHEAFSSATASVMSRSKEISCWSTYRWFIGTLSTDSVTNSDQAILLLIVTLSRGGFRRVERTYCVLTYHRTLHRPVTSRWWVSETSNDAIG